MQKKKNVITITTYSNTCISCWPFNCMTSRKVHVMLLLESVPAKISLNYLTLPMVQPACRKQCNMLYFQHGIIHNVTKLLTATLQVLDKWPLSSFSKAVSEKILPIFCYLILVSYCIPVNLLLNICQQLLTAPIEFATFHSFPFLYMYVSHPSDL